MSEIVHASGCLIGLRSSDDIVGVRLRRDDTILEPVTARRGWFHLQYTSRVAFMNEELPVGSTISYRYLLRVGINGHLLIVAEHGDLVARLLEIPDLISPFTRPVIDVAGLVRAVAAQPSSDYRLSALFARVDGYGTALRSLSLYGEDVTASEGYRDLAEKLTAFRVEISRALRTMYRLGVSSNGDLSFTYAGKATILEWVDRTIGHFLKGYITWPRQ